MWILYIIGGFLLIKALSNLIDYFAENGILDEIFTFLRITITCTFVGYLLGILKIGIFVGMIWYLIYRFGENILNLLKEEKEKLCKANLERLPLAERTSNNVLDNLAEDSSYVPYGKEFEIRLLRNMFRTDGISYEKGENYWYDAYKTLSKSSWQKNGDLYFKASFIGERNHYERLITCKYNFDYVSFAPRKDATGNIIRRGKIWKGRAVLSYEIHSKYPQKSWWEYSQDGTIFVYKQGTYKILKGNTVDLEDPGWESRY